MTRWLHRITLMLILGVVTTVGVAWGCVVGVGPIDKATAVAARHEGRASEWAVRRYDAFGTTCIVSEHRPGTSPFFNETDANPTELVPPWCGSIDEENEPRIVEDYRLVDGRGWPLRALYLMQRHTLALRTDRNQSLTFGTIQTNLDRPKWGQRSTARDLPYLPIWGGLVADTLFYATIWFGVSFGIGYAKRSIRTKRGRCLQCGYDLRGTVDGPEAGCPECGWDRPR